MEYISDFGAFDSARLAWAAGSIKKTYPFVKIFTAGKSVCKKPIYGFKVGRCRNTVTYFAGIHANEYITTTLLLRFITEMCSAISNYKDFCGINITSVLRDRSLIFVPMLNPDGCDIVISDGNCLLDEDYKRISRYCDGNFSTLKANFRGVDINHNFCADWDKVKKAECDSGITAPSAGMFGGYFPESEPETLSAVTLCKIMRPSSLIALHTQGEEIYYGYGNREDYAETKMAEVFSCLCGYRISSPDSISLSGGLKDWYSLVFKRPAFTFECGLGKNPLPQSDAKDIYARLCETFAISTLM